MRKNNTQKYILYAERKKIMSRLNDCQGLCPWNTNIIPVMGIVRDVRDGGICGTRGERGGVKVKDISVLDVEE